MPFVGFEPTVSASARAKTLYILYRSATVTDNKIIVLCAALENSVSNTEYSCSDFHFAAEMDVTAILNSY
jgi:hypothetical protein